MLPPQHQARGGGLVVAARPLRYRDDHRGARAVRSIHAAMRQREAVRVAGPGTGITPTIAMLRHRLFERHRTRYARPTWLSYSARSVGKRAFDRELAAIAADGHAWLRVVRVLAHTRGVAEGQEYE